MINLHDIRYVRLGTRDLDTAVRFATEVVGLQLARREGNSAYLRSDSRDHTLCYTQGNPADHTVGMELRNPEELDRIAGELSNAGFAVRLGTREEADQRRVRAFVNFRDPSGNSVDVVARPFHSGLRYYGARDAGIVGFNHIGLRTIDPRRDEAFWTGVCNARVSDWIGDAALLRVSTVHHTLALFPSNRAGVQHINHQVASVDDVLKAWYFLRERNVPIEFGPGRHPSSGAMFLYFSSPDGMTFEYSVGVGHIMPDDEPGYRPRQFPFEPWSICYWGAKPDIPEFRSHMEPTTPEPRRAA